MPMSAVGLRHATFTRLPRPRRTVHQPTRIAQSTFRSDRHFHVSRPSQSLWSDALITSSQIFQGVHSSTGLSWAASIALTATLFKLSLSPLDYFQRRMIARRHLSEPLKHAYRGMFEKQAAQQRRPDGKWLEPGQQKQFILDASARKSMALNRHFGVEWWQGWLGLLAFPVWIVNIRTLSLMAGFGRAPGQEYPVDVVPGLEEEVSAFVEVPSFLAEIGAQPNYMFATALSVSMIASVVLTPTKPGDSETSVSSFDDGQARAGAEPSNTAMSALKDILMGYALCLGPAALYMGFTNTQMLFWISGTWFTIVERFVMDYVFVRAPKRITLARGMVLEPVKNVPPRSPEFQAAIDMALK